MTAKSSVEMRVPEHVVAELFTKAYVGRIARDYDMIDDTRSYKEHMVDAITRARSGKDNGELLNYLTEIITGKEAVGRSYLITVEAKADVNCPL